MGDGTNTGFGRAALVWLALYALVLGTFLASATPHPILPDPAAGVICSHEAAPDEPAGSGRPIPHDGLCCPLACAGFLPVPAPGPVIAAWTAPALVAWVRMAGPGPRAPPIHHTSPRGPPAA